LFTVVKICLKRALTAAILLKGRYYPVFTDFNAIDKMAGIDALLKLMKDLRNPDTGCPWDIRQTSASIAAYTLDETHELLDAIERNDNENLQEELGDLLFNIVFHARIAEEKGMFDFDAVARGIVDKMIRRHPHVFADKPNPAINDEALARQWQALKHQEKSAESVSEFATESSSNSAIYRAKQLQKKAAESGFDWPDIEPVIDKLEEELQELKQAIKNDNKDEIQDELGDVMFVCVNLARHTKTNAEMALRQTNLKFTRRFKYVQQQMLDAGIEMTQPQLEQMELFWQESKGVVG
jgi:ATP diphosphatase